MQVKVKQSAKKVSLKEKMTSLDRFGEEFTMKFDGGKRELKTCTGAIMSVLLLIVLIIYGVMKANTLINKQQVDVISAISEEYFDEKLNFTETRGLSFAFALPGKPDISYAEIKYFVSEWIYDETNPQSRFYEIPSHICTREELGLSGDHSKFMPIND